MKKCKRIFAAFLAILSFMTICGSTSLSASASSGGGEKAAAGIQVWTNKKGATPYITLSQTPAKYKYKNWFGHVKYKNIYKNYQVTVKPICTVDGGKTKAKKFTKWLDSSSKKIKLEKGVYYEITVKCTVVPVKLPSVRGSFTQSSSWHLSKTKNCSNWK